MTNYHNSKQNDHLDLVFRHHRELVENVSNLAEKMKMINELLTKD